MRVVYEPRKVKYRGEEYGCMYISFYDDDEGVSYTTTESDGIWFGQITNQYREKHGIPYQDEIIALRERYGISAAKMSVILGFGANQYRLYEDGEVPSESNGKMIRGANNPRVFLDLVRSSQHQLTEKEYEKICAKVEEEIARSWERRYEFFVYERLFRSGRGENNGFAPLSTHRLKNLLLYILKQMDETFQTKMNKVLFYIDFMSYRDRGMAISGLAYNAIDFGPVPQRWDCVYSAFDEVNKRLQMVKDQECVSLSAGAEADMSSFSEQEMVIINTVCDKVKRMSSRAISEMSHNEVAWKDHVGKPGTIPFIEAFKLVNV